jgi:hypothetical protein
VKATFVKRGGGFALSISATHEAEMLLLELFLAQIQSPRRPLWVPSSGFVECDAIIEVAGGEVAFSASAGGAASDIDARLAAYAALIEERRRSLSDGERLTLMALCCTECGALNHRTKGLRHNAACTKAQGLRHNAACTKAPR